MFNGGKWDQWLPAKTTTCIAHMKRSDLPFHYTLADTFTVCDAYHCSMLGPTDLNRYYMWTGWEGNDGNGGGPVIPNDELAGRLESPGRLTSDPQLGRSAPRSAPATRRRRRRDVAGLPH
jgi:phospholipase C